MYVEMKSVANIDHFNGIFMFKMGSVKVKRDQTAEFISANISVFCDIL